ncbi:HlyD family type I secretion periplasmic adaptor subunit [Endozoicomonas arenosclerae]|uniref:HlyD family type I secretion periplasmic adaptor subunit n=1 Tax=Endozoicomonas arenosclerae TaxID=1633495 RepID=UPI000783A8AF|nr:HlyD family type I secretion periplasmic adaptor subunit [Endozoicomonas arenosclerae]
MKIVTHITTVREKVVTLWKQWKQSLQDYKREQFSLEYMPDTSAAILMQTPRGGRILIYLCVLTIVAFLIWAAFAKLDEMARGSGKVVPSTRVQIIQNLEGGIISNIYVSEGDKVNSEQPLMQLDSTRFLSLYRESQVEYQSLKVAGLRLKCEIDETELLFGGDVNDSPQAVERETALFNNRRAALNNELGVAEEKIKQSRHELNELKSRRNHLENSLKLATRELDLTRPLARDGAVSEVELLRQEQRVNELAGDLDAARLAIPRLESVMEAALKQSAELKLQFRQKAMQEHKENTLRLAQLEEVLTAHQDRVDRTLVRSPVSGTVKKVNLNTLGGVVQPGMDLMEVVPLQDQLLIEVQIRPKDIAFLRLGLNAIVKVTAYDYVIYGSLKGTVDHISADTIQDENGQSFYIVRVRTEKSHLGTSEKPLPIIPGMQTSVDILTGKKSVLDYLLKPIIRARHSALREA